MFSMGFRAQLSVLPCKSMWKSVLCCYIRNELTNGFLKYYFYLSLVFKNVDVSIYVSFRYILFVCEVTLHFDIGVLSIAFAMPNSICRKQSNRTFFLKFEMES